MIRFALIVVMLALPALGQNRIGSGTTYHTLSKSSIPYTLWTSCVYWATMDIDPAALPAWTAEDNGSGTLDDGVQTNASSRPAYQSGGSLLFTTDDYYNLNATVAAFHGGSTYSMAAWIKTTNTAAAITIGANYLFGGSAAQTTWQWIVLTNGLFQGSLITDSGGAFRGKRASVAVNNGAWHHIAATYNGNGLDSGYTLYVDGALDSSATSIGTGAVTTTPVNRNAMIGRRPVVATPFYFNGQLDDLMIFDRVLTPTEYTNLYYATVGGSR